MPPTTTTTATAAACPATPVDKRDVAVKVTLFQIQMKRNTTLFIPFDEHYYQGMKPYIDSNYRKFQLLQKLVQLNTLHINPDQYQGGFSS